MFAISWLARLRGVRGASQALTTGGALKSPFGRRVAIFLLLLMAVMVGATSTPLAAQRKNPSPAKLRASASKSFRAEFPTNGDIGAKFIEEKSGKFVDFRLKGSRGRHKYVGDNSASYSSSGDLQINYQQVDNQLKEEIVLFRPGVSQFAFDLKAPGLEARQEGKTVLLGDQANPERFRFAEPVAWDKEGSNVAVSMNLDPNGDLLVSLDQVVNGNQFPITIDPTVEGASSYATFGAYARRLFETPDGLMVLFFQRGLIQNVDLVYQVSRDAGSTWSSPTSIAIVPSQGEFSVSQAEDDFLLTYTSASGDTALVAFRELTRAGRGVALGLLEQRSASPQGT